MQLVKEWNLKVLDFDKSGWNSVLPSSKLTIKTHTFQIISKCHSALRIYGSWVYGLERSVSDATHRSRCHGDCSRNLWLVDDMCRSACVPLGVSRRRNSACTIHRWWRRSSTPRLPPPLPALWTLTFDLSCHSYRIALQIAVQYNKRIEAPTHSQPMGQPHFRDGRPSLPFWRPIPLSSASAAFPFPPSLPFHILLFPYPSGNGRQLQLGGQGNVVSFCRQQGPM